MKGKYNGCWIYFGNLLLLQWNVIIYVLVEATVWSDNRQSFYFFFCWLGFYLVKICHKFPVWHILSSFLPRWQRTCIKLVLSAILAQRLIAFPRELICMFVTFSLIRNWAFFLISIFTTKFILVLIMPIFLPYQSQNQENRSKEEEENARVERGRVLMWLGHYWDSKWTCKKENS